MGGPRRRAGLSESVEEYLQTIWRLQLAGGAVAPGAIAQRLGVAPPSVTLMLRRLQAEGLVERRGNAGVRCTERGAAVAHAVVRRHRLLERLLVDLVRVPASEVHQLACDLEHRIPDPIADRIEDALGGPATCPHGNPVDATADDGALRLWEAEQGASLLVVRVTDERPDFLAYLDYLGLTPGARVTLMGRAPFGGILHLMVGDARGTVAVGADVAGAVYVRPMIGEPAA
ncbi:MAG TPA: metal-dependent transcriptional regulator [Chthonomonadales bacterium]|nr:metal-dependent transcriptional regulator [Chthonomonadales bacterium]